MMQAEPLTEGDRVLWAWRFRDKRAYPDDKLLEMWREADEEPGEMAELVLEEIRVRELDF